MKKRWVYLNGEAYEVSDDSEAQVQIIREIEPYQSMIDGSVITSRSQHREHLKRHNCVEVGNDVKMDYYEKIPDVAPQQRHELIRSQVDRLTHSEFKTMLKRFVDNVKWNSRS